jgi:hypothetical protein
MFGCIGYVYHLISRHSDKITHAVLPAFQFDEAYFRAKPFGDLEPEE